MQFPLSFTLAFLSTPSARRATGHQEGAAIDIVISIHALREEGDGLRWGGLPCFPHFYPRPPRGGRLNGFGKLRNRFLFLSTPSARRATCRCCAGCSRSGISIHALREEGDVCGVVCVLIAVKFLSTPSARRATRSGQPLRRLPAISIHALREEGDPTSAPFERCRTNFYPRPPRGGRHSFHSAPPTL